MYLCGSLLGLLGSLLILSLAGCCLLRRQEPSLLCLFITDVKLILCWSLTMKKSRVSPLGTALRTVRDSFPSYGSPRQDAYKCSKVWGGGVCFSEIILSDVNKPFMIYLSPRYRAINCISEWFSIPWCSKSWWYLHRGICFLATAPFH